MRMRPGTLKTLICPHCAADFNPQDQSSAALCSANGHAFDVAKQGYVNFLTGHGTNFTPDSGEMVAARQDFLDAGHYAPLMDAMSQTVRLLTPPTGTVLDAGTGTGAYLHRVVEKTSYESIGLDISKFALRKAARLNPNTLNLVWDVWRPLPVAANSVDTVMVVFAPRNPAEFARILVPGGHLVVVVPTAAHLAEVAAAAGLLNHQENKHQALIDSLATHFTITESTMVEFAMPLTPGQVSQLALMGPAGHHERSAETTKALAELAPETAVTASFEICVFMQIH